MRARRWLVLHARHAESNFTHANSQSDCRPSTRREQGIAEATCNAHRTNQGRNTPVRARRRPTRAFLAVRQEITRPTREKPAQFAHQQQRLWPSTARTRMRRPPQRSQNKPEENPPYGWAAATHLHFLSEKTFTSTPKKQHFAPVRAYLTSIRKMGLSPFTGNVLIP